MIPTVEQVKAKVAAWFGDPNKRIFKDDILQPFFETAWEELYTGLLAAEAPVISKEKVYTLAAGETELSPDDAEITDFGELVRQLEERRTGSGDKFIPMSEFETLSQRNATTSLLEYTWREDKWFFVGATGDVDVLIPYFSSGVAPSTGTTGIDGCMNFLWARTAALVGPGRGFAEDAERADRLARGNRLDNLSGYLFDFLAPIERSKQRMPVQPKPYSANPRANRGRRRPYISI